MKCLVPLGWCGAEPCHGVDTSLQRRFSLFIHVFYSYTCESNNKFLFHDIPNQLEIDFNPSFFQINFEFCHLLMTQCLLCDEPTTSSSCANVAVLPLGGKPFWKGKGKRKRENDDIVLHSICGGCRECSHCLLGDIIHPDDVPYIWKCTNCTNTLCMGNSNGCEDLCFNGQCWTCAKHEFSYLLSEKVAKHLGPWLPIPSLLQICIEYYDVNA